ncbi:MAG: SAM-dependent methyltransferase [Bacteroidales bacterium]|nr:SAM-dependent methyltransferase [Bacteroidales bacterium]
MLEAALYLIPVTLGETAIGQVLPAYNHDVVVEIRHFIVENVRSARRFLKKVEPAIDIDSLTFYELNQHTDRRHIDSYLEPLVGQKQPVGIISEAGCPAVADPGADVVAIAQRKGLKVIQLVGPSSMIMSVMASGLNGQSFAFNGYLPIDDGQRTARLKQLEARALAESQTQLFIETPYRNVKMMQTLLAVLRPSTRICLASNITCPDEQIRTLTVAEWKQKLHGLADDQLQRVVPRVPSIFLIGQ